jgi:NADH-quinone oxidoreductase subunit C
MNGVEITKKLTDHFGADAILEDPLALAPGIKVSADRLIEVMTFLRDNSELSMDFMNCLTGLDLQGLPDAESEDLRTIYHLYSYVHRHEISVNVDLSRENPVCPSITGLWASAVWQEREAYDLLGIIYEGHPNLTRILLPTEFEGHPLRKDWKEGSHVMGISTQRDTPVELLKFFHEVMGGKVPDEIRADVQVTEEDGP